VPLPAQHLTPAQAFLPACLLLQIELAGVTDVRSLLQVCLSAELAKL
jgi:hypothetical protein